RKSDHDTSTLLGPYLANMKLRDYQKWALEQIAKVESFNYDNTLAYFNNTFRQFKNPVGEFGSDLCREFPGVIQCLSEKTKVAVTGTSLAMEQQKSIYSAIAGYTGWNGVDKELAYRVVRDATAKYRG